VVLDDPDGEWTTHAVMFARLNPKSQVPNPKPENLS
jgi:hypothetical protein